MLGDTTQTEVLTITPAAAKVVKDLLEQRNLQGYALRVFVSGAGCSGFQYGMALEGNIQDSDHTCEFDGVTVVVDQLSIDYLRGSTIDYVDDGARAGFKIDNPNVISSCGCGNSSSTNNDPSDQSGNGGCSGCQ